MQNLSLSSCEQNKQYTILSVKIQTPNVKRRFLELGILPNKRIVVVKKSILKKVLLIQLDDLTLAIRDSFAKEIYVR